MQRLRSFLWILCGMCMVFFASPVWAGYVNNGNGTVTDTSTGLMWQRDTPDNAMTWLQALSYCENSNLAGYTDWRLPTRKELGSLVDYSRFNPAINTTYFPDTVSSFYWSSTTNANGTFTAWGVYFGYGYDSLDNKGNGYYVRAVRGGQSGSLGNLFILSPNQADMWPLGIPISITWNTQIISGNMKISISRDGGKTYSSIADAAPNNGSYPWTVTGPASVNCMIKIEPLSDLTKGTVQGLFAIVSGDVNGDGLVDLTDAILSLQIVSGLVPNDINPAADVNGDGKIGMAEAIYAMQKVAGLR